MGPFNDKVKSLAKPTALDAIDWLNEHEDVKGFHFKICEARIDADGEYHDDLVFYLAKISRLVALDEFSMETEDSSRVVKVSLRLSAVAVQQNMTLEVAIRTLCKSMMTTGTEGKQLFVENLTPRSIWGIIPLSDIFRAYWTASFFNKILSEGPRVLSSLAEDFMRESRPYLNPTFMVFAFAALAGLHDCFHLMQHFYNLDLAETFDLPNFIQSVLPTVGVVFTFFSGICHFEIEAGCTCKSLGIFEPSWYSWRPEDLDMFFEAVQQSDLVGRRPKVDAINGGYLQRDQINESWYRDLDFEYAMALVAPHEVTNVEVGSEKQVGNLNDMLAAFDRYYCDPVYPDHKKYPPSYQPGCNTTHCDCGSSAPPKVLSISWGWTEAAFTSDYLQRQCLEFLKLGLMGTTVIVSVSDHGTASEGGAFCIDDKMGNGTSGRFSPTFPASCPWVTSVGGTQMLYSSAPRIPIKDRIEKVYRKIAFETLNSSGGGFSNIFSAPSYQAPHIASYNDIEKDHLDKIRSRFNSTGRGFPDVSARADSYLIALKGKWQYVSGTSASNPVFASIITLTNSERMNAGKEPVGFINPVLYAKPDILNDVMIGSNKGCGVDEAFQATGGWDAVTGLGSPDYERMRDFFMSLP
ncbi:peptidase S8/S53 domain-containing protein [Fusarium venenatum]|uniref:peptidase S8/S53 domain-containing protein n=1 Tax=Fusarium venenatum TaxID=56646 RepID=UPI001DD85F71|nr:peptidase S8/S53 domain-containing protein [Fusarium venenatum]